MCFGAEELHKLCNGMQRRAHDVWTIVSHCSERAVRIGCDASSALRSQTLSCIMWWKVHTESAAATAKRCELKPLINTCFRTRANGYFSKCQRLGIVTQVTITPRKAIIEHVVMQRKCDYVCQKHDLLLSEIIVYV